MQEGQANIRVAMVGCGAVARWHASTLYRIPGVEIVALVDPSQENLNAMVKWIPQLSNVPTFSGPEEMFKAIGPDAVEICTPHTLHYEHVVMALEHGAHVLCEKPLACSVEHAQDIKQRAQDAGKVVMVSYQRRLDPGYNYIKNAITSGEIGDIQTISVICCQAWKKGTTGTWRQNPELSGGGMLMDSGSHLADVLLWLTSQPVESVYATVDNCDTPVDINSTSTIKFANGTQAQFTVNGNLPITWIEEVLIIGTEGILKYESDPQHPWRTGRITHSKDGNLIQPLRLQMYSSPDEAWIAAIRGEGENPSPPDAGVRVAELTTAIYESARTGQAVKISDISPVGR